MEEDQNRIEESVIDESIIHENGTAENEDEEFGKKAFAIFAIFLVFLFILVLLNPGRFKNLFKRKEKDKSKRDRVVFSPDGVVLDTPEEIEKEIETLYGEVELLSSRETGIGRDRCVECIFRDVAHDFPFRAWSTPAAFFSIDGANFAYKGTYIRSNYVESYTNWISIQLRPILEEHGILYQSRIDKNSMSARSLGRAYSFRDNVLVSPEDLWYDDKAFVLSTIRSFNPPRAIEEKLSEVVVIKSGKSQNNAGTEEPTKIPLSEEEQTAQSMKRKMRDYFSIEAEYVRREATIAGEVPGLMDQVFFYREVTEETPVYLYIFRCEEKEFFVCDVEVRQISDDGQRGYILYYQNYQQLKPAPYREGPDGGGAGYDASHDGQNDSPNE